jgi:hypothetical protein
VAHDVGSLDVEMTHEQRTVGGVVGQAWRALAPFAAGEACPVIAQKAMVAGK